MQHFSVRPQTLVASLWDNRSLVLASVVRDVFGRYRGSVLGIVWSFFNPLLMLAIYTFVFSAVLKARWSADSTSHVEFALVLFAGLMVFNLFAETVNKAPSLIVNNVNFVKKVIYPLEILPYVAMGSSLFHFFVSLAVWLCAYMFFYGVPHWTVIYVPVVVLPFCIFAVGVSWALASLGVFLRDVSQFIGAIVMGMMFLAPIFYPATSLPENYRALLYLNPVTSIVEMVRDVLFWGSPPNGRILLASYVFACLAAWIGFAWFQKTRKGFADVL